MDMFEQASRLKLRFESSRGLLTVEDLWELPLQSSTGRPNLDGIAIGLYEQVKHTADIPSFVNPTTENEQASTLQLAFDIAKHIIGVRVAERDELKLASERREKKQRILELIARKEDEALGERSVDELRALAESL